MKKLLVLMSLVAFTTTAAHAQFWKAKSSSSDNESTTLVVHPDVIILKGESKGKAYYFFNTEEGLFFTEREDLATEIVAHLPARYIEGRAVTLVGSRMRAFTKFKRKQLAFVSKGTGTKINKRTDVFVITGHSLLTNYDPTKSKSSGTFNYNPPPAQ